MSSSAEILLECKVIRARLFLFLRKRNHSLLLVRIHSCRPEAATEIMRKFTLTIICLSSLTLSLMAEDNSSPAADNSSRNERDRSGQTQTSGDQSNSRADIQTTAAIRRAVIHDDSLSTTAKNVKIITENGIVTLRGPVMGEAEKTKIVELARTHAGNAKVKDQLEVKASK